MLWTITAAITNAMYYGTMVALIVYEASRFLGWARMRMANSR